MEGLIDGLRREAQEIRGRTVADSLKNTYEDSFRVYERVVRTEFQMDPMPIEIEKTQTFLVFMKWEKRCYNTLAGYARGSSYYFRSNGLNVLTQDMQFNVSANGLRREMMTEGDFCPKAKAPFQLEWFDRIASGYPMDDFSNCIAE